MELVDDRPKEDHSLISKEGKKPVSSNPESGSTKGVAAGRVRGVTSMVANAALGSEKSATADNRPNQKACQAGEARLLHCT